MVVVGSSMGRRGVGSCYYGGRCAHLVAALGLEEFEERSPRVAEAARPRAHGPHEGHDGLSRRLVFHAPQSLALLPDQLGHGRRVGGVAVWFALRRSFGFVR